MQSIPIIEAALQNDPTITPEQRKRVLKLIKQPEEPQALETLTRKQTAKIFGVHPGSLKRWEKAGRIHAIKLTPRCVRYDAAEVRAMIERGAV